MPENFTYTLLPEQQLAVQRFSGTVNAADIIAALETMWANPLWHRSFNGISDFSHCVAAGNAADVKRLREFVENHPSASEGRWVVMVDNPLATALCIIYARTSQRPVVHVCSTWDAACDYLRVTIPPTL